MNLNSSRSDSAENKLLGRLLIVAAAAMWSTSGFFAKSPFFDDWPVEVRGPLLAFWRAAFAAVILLPMTLSRQGVGSLFRPMRPPNGDRYGRKRLPTLPTPSRMTRGRQWTWWMLPMALAFAAMNWSYLKGMTLTSAANAIWLQSTAPIWVFLIGAAVLKERISRLDWMTLGFVAAGVGLIVTQEAKGESLPGVLFGLTSGVALAIVYVFLRQLRRYDTWWLVAWNHTVAAALFAPYVAWQGIWPSPWQLVVLACFGAFQMGLPYVLFARGLRHIPSHEGSGLALLEPLLVPVWVFLAWGHLASYQGPAWWTLAGGVLILGGLLLRYTAETLRRPGAAT
ncbi:MAG: DMT family transporter [Planctomycetes bacterium]|nr:DMT family transporter [Planctomycetota bacterium]